MAARSPTTGQTKPLPNRLVSAANGTGYAYRDVGEGTPLLSLLQHFRGNLDNWDPALIDALASTRRVVTFDNTGVGGSTGTTPTSFTQMARDAIAFLEAMEFEQVDLLRRASVRRLILASSAPHGVAKCTAGRPK